jgi:hypothetical protein
VFEAPAGVAALAGEVEGVAATVVLVVPEAVGAVEAVEAVELGLLALAVAAAVAAALEEVAAAFDAVLDALWLAAMHAVRPATPTTLATPVTMRARWAGWGRRR